MMKNEDGSVLRCEVAAGGKHQNNPEFRHHCQDWLLRYCRDHGFALEDNNRIEAERKQQRYQEKHEQLRDLIIRTASSCSSFEQLKRELKLREGINLVLRGKTLSIHLPNSRKGLRLDRLGISREDILHAMGIDQKSIDQMNRQETLNIEKKKYIQWLRERRVKNAIRAEDTLADAAALIAGNLNREEQFHRKREFQELYDLIRQTTYLERDLQTELDKITHLLERWKQYLDAELSQEDRMKHRSYVEWCGCDPGSDLEFYDLQTEHDVIALQIKEAASVRQALLESADTWKQQNEENRFQFHLEWTITKEAQLRHQLRYIKANRKKLERIASNCQIAADRRIIKREYLAKADHYRELWHEKLMEEKAVREELRSLKRDQRQTRRQIRAEQKAHE